MACPDFPLCQGQFLPPMDFSHGFTWWRALGRTGEGELIPFQALVAIHWTHRVFAVVVVAAVGVLIWRLWQHSGLLALARGLLGAAGVAAADGVVQRGASMAAVARGTAQRRRRIARCITGRDPASNIAPARSAIDAEKFSARSVPVPPLHRCPRGFVDEQLDLRERRQPSCRSLHPRCRASAPVGSRNDRPEIPHERTQPYSSHRPGA